MPNNIASAFQLSFCQMKTQCNISRWEGYIYLILKPGVVQMMLWDPYMYVKVILFLFFATVYGIMSSNTKTLVYFEESFYLFTSCLRHISWEGAALEVLEFWFHCQDGGGGCVSHQPHVSRQDTERTGSDVGSVPRSGRVQSPPNTFQQHRWRVRLLRHAGGHVAPPVSRYECCRYKKKNPKLRKFSRGQLAS